MKSIFKKLLPFFLLLITILLIWVSLLVYNDFFQRKHYQKQMTGTYKTFSSKVNYPDTKLDISKLELKSDLTFIYYCDKKINGTWMANSYGDFESVTFYVNNTSFQGIIGDIIVSGDTLDCLTIEPDGLRIFSCSGSQLQELLFMKNKNR